MTSKPVAVIDVDLTVVDSVEGEHGWLSWLNSKTGLNLTAAECDNDYNLGKKFLPHWPEYCTETPMDWWRYPGIYDKLKPLPDAVTAIELISQTHDIVFVSHCKGLHMKSKVAFLKRYFGHVMAGFIATKEKQFISTGSENDIVIDDRNEHLVKFKNTKHQLFKFNTKWSQFVSLSKEMPDRHYVLLDGWKEIVGAFTLTE